MPKLNRTHLTDLRGASLMAFDALAGVSGVVEQMHATIQRHPGPLGESRDQPARGIAGLVYRTVHGGIRLVGAGVDALLSPIEQFFPAGGRTPGHEAWVAVANGIYGDYLERTANPLAIGMSLRYRNQAIDVADPAAALREAGSPPASSRLLVLVHGLCMNDLQWNRKGHDHGVALAAELGYSVLYLRYNSGLHVHENGQRFAQLLEGLIENWPHPLDELSIIGHSMGGLVARSACLHARERKQAWLQHLRRLVFLGTPHLGAPLERSGNGLDFLLDLSPYSAPLTRAGRQRSAGIKDLRHGAIAAGRAALSALPVGVECYAAAATLAERRGLLASRLVGDGLVPLNSALGRHRDRSKALRIPKSHQWVGYEMGHLELLNRPEVYAQLKAWLCDRT